MPSGEARGAAGAACCVPRGKAGSICSLLGSSSGDRKDPTVAANNPTSGLMSPARLKNMRGSSSLHTTWPMPSNLYRPLRSSHTAATHRLLLLLTHVPARTRPSGGSNNNSKNPLGLVISRRDRRRHSCGNSSRNKPSTKACLIRRRSSGRKVSLPRQVVTYTGTHRLLHSHTILKAYQTKEEDSRGHI